MLDTNRPIFAVALAALGGIHYFSMMYFLDVVHSIEWPLWLSRLAAARGYNTAQLLWETLTSVPAIIIISSLVAFALSKLASRHFFRNGLLVLALSLSVAVLLNPIEGSYLQAIRSVIWPAHWSQFTIYLALYVTLPTVTWLCGRRADAA